MFIKTIYKKSKINSVINESVKSAMEEIINNRRINAKQTAKNKLEEMKSNCQRLLTLSSNLAQPILLTGSSH
jgi:hypothetical protein